eukprot:scaffold48_cov311-Pinguiococcus_pyrenoidosus.AAC.205
MNFAAISTRFLCPKRSIRACSSRWPVPRWHDEQDDSEVTWSSSAPTCSISSLRICLKHVHMQPPHFLSRFRALTIAAERAEGRRSRRQPAI